MDELRNFRFDREMAFDQPGDGRKDHYSKKKGHFCPAGRPVAGGYMMGLGLLAAYDTVPSEFTIHHITAQFFRPADGNLPLTWEVIRSNDQKNNSARIVFVSQGEDVRVCMFTMGFTRQPIQDGLSLSYQARPPDVFEAADDKSDELKYLGGGFLHGHSMPRVMRRDSGNIEDSKTQQWLKCGVISSDANIKMHHVGLALLSDYSVMDAPARLHNLQLGIGERKVGASQEDSPYDERSSPGSSDTTDYRTAAGSGYRIATAGSDFRAMATLNHTVHFYDVEAARADEWSVLEVATSAAHGGRVLIHSKLFSQAGKLLVVCTQEAYYRLKKGAAPQDILRSNL